jgi:hypothetical protein
MSDPITAFARAFRYHGGSIFAPWRNVSRDAKPTGDCQDFAWSVLSLATDGKPWRAILTGRAMIWRAHSPVNRVLPRHAVLWLNGKGWIDSTNREWRATPSPHRLRWPAGLPILALVACLFGAPAFAQEQCAPVADALAGLATNYAEAPRVTALMGGHVLIITVAETGGWTALEVKPNGEACIVAAGEAFEMQAAPIPGDDT